MSDTSQKSKDFDKLRRAQSDMRLCIGIAVGIELATNGAIDPKKSFIVNAIDACEDCDDDFLREFSKSLQEYINLSYEDLGR